MTPSLVQEDEALQQLTQSMTTKQKLIDEAARKMREAESKAQDLSINIQYVISLLEFSLGYVRLL